MDMASHGNCPRFPSLAECALRYNVSESERESDELIHQSEPDLPPISDVEISLIYRLPQPVIDKHNRAHGFTDQGADYYYLVGDRWEDDRTFNVTAYGNAEYTAELVLDLQLLLRRKLSLWRIALLANVLDDRIYVYPECVRNNDATLDEPLAVTLRRVNAHERAWRQLVNRYSVAEQPGYSQRTSVPPRLCETKVAYNANEAECAPAWPRFNTVSDPPELTTVEYLDLDGELVRSLEQYGPVVCKNHLSDTSKQRLNAHLAGPNDSYAVGSDANPDQVWRGTIHPGVDSRDPRRPAMLAAVARGLGRRG